MFWDVVYEDRETIESIAFDGMSGTTQDTQDKSAPLWNMSSFAMSYGEHESWCIKDCL